MANEPLVTIVGNLTADPEVRQAGNSSVVNLTIASTPRTFNRQSNEWENGETLFLRASAWRDFAENIAQNLHKGQRVIAQGNLKQRSFQDKDGNERTALELDILEIGPAIQRNKPNTQRAGQPQAQGSGDGGRNWQSSFEQSNYGADNGFDPNAPF